MNEAIKAGTKIIETRTSRVYLRSDGIVFVQIKDGAKQDLADAKENLTAISNAAQGKPCLLLVDLTPVASQSAECRAFYTAPENSHVNKAVALLTNSVFSKVIGNFFVGLNKSTTIPIKLFESEEEAVQWLFGISRSGQV